MSEPKFSPCHWLTMDQWPKEYPKCNCQATLHKLLLNCLHCGLVYCIQNAKTDKCSFCAHPFAGNRASSTPPTHTESVLKTALHKASALTERLVAADSDSLAAQTVQDRETLLSAGLAPITSIAFLPASELATRAREIEEHKARLEEDRRNRAKIDLASCLDFT